MGGGSASWAGLPEALAAALAGALAAAVVATLAAALAAFEALFPLGSPSSAIKASKSRVSSCVPRLPATSLPPPEVFFCCRALKASRFFSSSTISPWPLFWARSRAVLPSVLRASSDARASNSMRAHSALPAWQAAISAVQPLSAVALLSAPAANSAFSASEAPPKAAAMRGVAPSGEAALASARASRRKRTARMAPSPAAAISGVVASVPRAPAAGPPETVAPASIRASKTRTCPASEAEIIAACATACAVSGWNSRSCLTESTCPRFAASFTTAPKCASPPEASS
mmetsp:Transcript_65985/g.189866  ORF Transcript_65985/g.189866 Transcript_65985/m.189866 type:complete len:287 (+) Transcript_65985:302-1162(+)